MIKINPKHAVRMASRTVQANSPVILTAIGVVGTAATGYLAAKAAFKAAETIEAKNVPETPKLPLDLKEKALLTWKLYIPAVTVGATTIVCIVAANRIQVRRMAALAAAYGVISGDFDDYREKAAEMLGAKKNAELNEKRSRNEIEKAPAPTGGLLLPEGKSWFLDKTTKRYIITTYETIKGVQNELNYTIINHGDASLNDFYAQLGMDPIQIGDILGWNRKHKVEVSFTPVLTEDRGAVTAFEFVKGPLPNFYKAGPIDPDKVETY